MKDTGLKKSLIKTISIILGGFVGVVGIIIGVMYLTGSFDPIVVTPNSIKFEQELYEPDIYQYDENGDLILVEGEPVLTDSFYILVTGEPDNITVDEIELTVSDTRVVSLESTTARIGEPIKVNVTMGANDLPNGGATTITARANGGIYGMDSCKIFIDVPVTDIEINTSTNADTVHVNQIIDLAEPNFLPSNSKNPSIVSQGEPIVAKPDKQYIYKLYFELVQPEATTWIDVEHPFYANNDSIKTAKWLDANKTQVIALKTGRFKLEAYAFDSYKEQEKIVTQETEAEKLARMKVVSERIFEVSEIDIESIEATNYNDLLDQVDMTYKKTFKLYLRTNKTSQALASENAYNLGVVINPDSETGMTYQNMFYKIKDIYITTNLADADSAIEIVGRSVQGADGETYIKKFIKVNSS